MRSFPPWSSVLALAVLWSAPVAAADAPPTAGVTGVLPSAGATGSLPNAAGPSGGTPNAAGSGGLANPVAALSLDRLSSTREHPLFAPTRRLPPPPPPPPVARAAPPPPPPPSVTLVGIVMDGMEARAVVRGATAQEIRVQIGDDIGGWKVSQIEGRKLVLSSLDGRFATFTMFNTDKANGAPQGSPSASAKSPQTSNQPQAGAPAAKARRRR